ncbi:MAG: hypothetical protein EOP86_22170 [Verrucomicrobiaceae bacterium]|nr:MAG: hypothetical protein EOP86_22170 [Verrucomicrobiaceae bacterium]
MINLFPEKVMAGLKRRFGAEFDQLNHVERVALPLAGSEGTVNHARLRSVTTEHPVDLSKTLRHLTQAGMLESTGGRGAVYHLPGEAIPTPDDVLGPAPRIPTASSPNLEPSSPHLEPSSPHLGVSSPHLEPSSPHLGPSSPNLTGTRDPDGCLLSEQLSLPVIDDLSVLSADLRGALETLATIPRSKAKVPRPIMIEAILKLCEGRFVVLRCLAELVHRNPQALRDHYLTGLLQDRRLTLAFPKTPTHERQAYSSTHTATP